MGVRLGGRLDVRVCGRDEPSRYGPHSFPQPVGAATRSHLRGSVLTTVSQKVCHAVNSHNILRLFVGVIWVAEKWNLHRQCCPLSGGKHVEKNFAFGERHIPQPAWH